MRYHRLPFFYGWVIVTVAFVTMGLGVNVRTAFSLLYPPILDEFGWERGMTAGAFSFGFLVSAVLSPFVGRLMDRRGPRVVIEMGVACMAAGLLLAPAVIEVVFGPAYGEAVLPFQIVICMIPVAWLSGHFRFTLIVSGHQRLEFLASALAGVTTLVLALAGASEEMVNHFTGKLTKKVSRAIRRRIQQLGPTRLSDMEAAQQAIVSRAARQLARTNLAA